ncbi:DUF536 domain-containing protein [Lactococcus lactis]|uniref:DUF536 domain-containing protein n=1 Tax=Lactococcus lactis TaxID=1358 RepID=UPI002FE4A649
MSENLKTIKELADELSVTKQNIQYHYQRLPKELQLKSSNGSNLINSKAEKIILGKVESSRKSNTKDQQISNKDRQIDQLTKLIDQQQQLQLTTVAENQKLKDHIQKLSGLLETPKSARNQQENDKKEAIHKNKFNKKV